MPATAFSKIKNNVATLLNTSMDASQTNLAVIAGAGTLFPPAPFFVSVEFEVMKCTGIVGDNLTVTRGQDGTTAAVHAAGAIVEMRGNAALWTEVQSAVNNIESGTNQIPFNPPDGSIANAKLAPDVYRPNILQNGGFEYWIATSITSTGEAAILTNKYTADSWQCTGLGADSLTVSRDSVNKENGVYCASCVITVSGNTQSGIYQTILWSSPAAAQLVGKTVTLSARVKTTTANSARLAIYNGSAWVNSSYHTGGGTYQTLTLTTTITSGILNVNSPVWFGVSYTLSCTAYIDSISAVFGAAASDYQPAIAYPDSIPNQRLASDVARANQCVNGGFNIWQRGNGPFTAQSAYGADRWYNNIGASSAMSVVRAVSSPPPANSSKNVAQITYTHSSFSSLAQLIRASDCPSIMGRTVSFSASIYATVANGIRLNIASDGASNINTMGDFVLLTNQWVRATVTATIPSDATYAVLQFYLSASGTYSVSDAMLVVGPVPADYVPMHPADDLARCLRYYEPIFVSGSISFAIVTGNGTTGAAGPFIPFKVKKVVTPSITSAVSWNLQIGNGGGVGATASAAGICIDGYTHNASGTSTSNGTTYQMFPAGTHGQGMAAEANP